MQLPFFQTAIKELSLMQTKWKAILDPFLAIQANQSLILSKISLSNGTTVVNHMLGRKLVGWNIVGINGAATIYDNQANNQTPQLTLILISNAAVIVNIEVF
jgi:hypothetical protein